MNVFLDLLYKFDNIDNDVQCVCHIQSTEIESSQSDWMLSPMQSLLSLLEFIILKWLTYI